VLLCTLLPAISASWRSRAPSWPIWALWQRDIFCDAPADSLFKLRQFAEFVAKDIAAQNALLPSSGANFDDVLRALKLRATVPPQVLEYFHHLRRVGNAATHEAIGTQRDALHALKLSWALGEWYHKSYQGRPRFRAGPFVPPRPPIDASDALRAEIDQLRGIVRASSDAEAKVRLAAQQAANNPAFSRLGVNHFNLRIYVSIT
jgi:type I restriction enzyme R subunit